MIIFLILSIIETDISFIRINNFTETKRDPASWIFPNYNVVESIQDFISLIPNISQTKWIFISSQSTAVAPRYVSYILNSIQTEKTENLLLGRFGCIPTSFINGIVHEFKLCYRFPILESGFAFTSDLLQTKRFQELIKEIENDINSSNNDEKINSNLDSLYEFDSEPDYDSTEKYNLSSLKIEYLIGLGTSEANAIDDFRFSYFASNSTFRNSLFLASFNPSSSSNLDIAFLHASGIRFKEKVTPFAEGEIILGTGLNFNGEIFPFDKHIKISCLPYNVSLPYSRSPFFGKSAKKDKSTDGSLVLYPPYHYSDHFDVQIACF